MTIKSKLISCAFVLMISTFLQAQNPTIYVFDFITQTLDSIVGVDFDSTITSAQTPYHLGEFDENIADLTQEVPTDNVFPESEFTINRRASLDFDINDYPLRTTVKVFASEDGELNARCAGNMVSCKHVFIAAHCVADFMTHEIDSSLIYVCPVFDNGDDNPNFECTLASKIYFFKDFGIDQDMAILELTQSIGEETGWLGLGMDANEEIFTDNVFYKFVYPFESLTPIDSNNYNGDSLFYRYGTFEPLESSTYPVVNSPNTISSSGDGGTPIIYTADHYTIYGSNTYSTFQTHALLTPELYHNFADIIGECNVVGIEEVTEVSPFNIYPNPSNGIFNINRDTIFEKYNLQVYNMAGELILEKFTFMDRHLDLSDQPVGQYNLVFSNDDHQFLERALVVK